MPGDLNSLTGGYGYDRQIIAGLRAAGWSVDVVALDAGFPWPDAAARSALRSRSPPSPDGTLVVVDGLAFGAMPDLAEQHAARLRWVALVHHPLALETGLDAHSRAARCSTANDGAGRRARVIVTSAATARELAGYGVAAERIHVVHPGHRRRATGHRIGCRIRCAAACRCCAWRR